MTLFIIVITDYFMAACLSLPNISEILYYVPTPRENLYLTLILSKSYHRNAL